MKKLLLALLLLCFQSTFATNYFLSSAGNDTSLGTSSVTPWKTISKLNTITYSPGDSVFFRCGDTFRGKIVVGESGSSISPIVFTSYGNGNSPIISGAQVITGWTNTGNIYQATTANNVANFFVNDAEQTLARYPNEHQYLRLDSATTGYLHDNSLTSISTSLITGSKICIHTAQWCWEKTAVLSFAGDKITYGIATQISGLNNYGYFFYNNINHLDTLNEWFFDSGTNVISYIPGSGINMSTAVCEGSVSNAGLELAATVSYLFISNLHFEKQVNAGISILDSLNQHITIDHCTFARQYNYGVIDKGRHNEVSNCYFREVDGIGIYLNGQGSSCTIHHNTLRNIGQFRNSGIGQQINCSAICNAFTDSAYIHHNDIDSTGYCGISADGSYNIIEKNVVNHAMLLNNDGAALKSYAAQSHHNTFRNNFVINSDGNTEGTANGNFITPAIYFDFNVNNCLVENNTIYNHNKKGIFQNSGNNNNTLKGNVIYGCEYGIDLNGTQAQSTAINGMSITHNVIFALDTAAYLIRQIDFTNVFNAGYIDSNYYFQPYSNDHFALRYISTNPTSYTFADWQLTGNDLQTKSNFVNWSLPTNYSELFTNPTDNVSTISLGTTQYLDLDSNIVCGSITLQPYTSEILINTNTNCTIGIEGLTNNESVSLFPNPSSSELFIKTKNLRSTSNYSLVDMTGNIIMTGEIKNEIEKISVSQLPPGIYLLRTSENTNATRFCIVR